MPQPASAERMERVYERLSGTYDLMFERVFQPGREEALKELDIKPGEKVLEVGVGTGLVLPMYPRDADVVGIDLSEAMLSEAHERIVRHALRHVRVQRMDAAALQFPDASFDAVFAPYVISVVPDPTRVMSEMARVCRPGGRIVVVNHFLSANPLKAAIEKAFSPLSLYMGFHLDTPIGSVMSAPGLELSVRRRVNLFGNWTLLKFRKG